jgi:hypothetical protein
MSGEALERVLARLPSARRRGKEWRALCPAHEDREPSLTVALKNGRVLLHCFAGCSTEAIVGALGLTASDLFDSPSNPAEKGGSVVYEIRDSAGHLVARHHRADSPDGSKRFWWECDGRKGLGGLRVTALPLYGTERLSELPAGARLTVTEGEKAAAALLSLGIAAVGTVTGAEATPEAEPLRPLCGFEVVLWPDADGPGGRHMQRVAQRLISLGLTPRRVRWPEAPPGGDAADFVAGMERSWEDEGEARGRVEALLASAEEWKLEGEAAAGLRLVEVRVFLADETPLPAPVIENIGLAGTLTLLFGPPESGKSWLGMEAARCVTSGRHFLGRFACTKGPALLVEQESAPPLLRARVAELEQGDPRPQDAAPLWLAPLQGLRLDDPAGRDLFAQEVRRLHPRLIVVDTLIAVAGAMDFLSATVVREWLLYFRTLAAEVGAAVWLLCHSPKWMTKEPQLAALYGSVDFGASADVALATVALDGGENFRLCCVKNRWGTNRPDLTFSIAPGEQGGLTLAATSSTAGLGRLILDALDSEEWTPGAELNRLVTEAGFTDRSGRKAMEALMKRGLVQRDKDPLDRRLYIFKLAAEQAR